MALEKWYRRETLEIVTKRIDFYADNFKDKVSGIKVKQKRRWASCTGKNAILFNWRISMARPDVIDYIVVHEMCHMDHRNHSIKNTNIQQFNCKWREADYDNLLNIVLLSLPIDIISARLYYVIFELYLS